MKVNVLKNVRMSCMNFMIFLQIVTNVGNARINIRIVKGVQIGNS